MRLFGSTKMAALMAATDGGMQQQTTDSTDGDVVHFGPHGDTGQQDAAALS